jgi:hypothetical protein
MPGGVLVSEREGNGVYTWFICGWCGTDCKVWLEPVASWWTPKFRAPDLFECWWCGEDSTSPPGPWEEAD